MGFGTKMTTLADAIRGLTGTTVKLGIDDMTSLLTETLIPNIDSNNVPPYCENKAAEAVYVAQTWWNTRINGSRAFDYRDGVTFLNDGELNNSSGEAVLDCSTFIHLVLMGITYDKSPYASNINANATYDKSNLTPNSDYTWSDGNLQGSTLLASDANSSGFVRTAADLAKYYYLQGRCFTDPSIVKPGDLTFHANGANGRFMNIKHVGIIDLSRNFYYNATGSTDSSITSETTIVRSRINLDDLNNLDNGNARSDVVFFARPDYETRRSYNWDPNYNYLAAPWQTATVTKSNVIYTVDISSGTITTSSSGATAATTFDLLNSNTFLYLEPGTYKLTGAPPRTDRGSRVDYSYYGLRIYPSDGRAITSQVTGFNSASYTGSTTTVTQNNAYVWDKGYGAEFTITTAMEFYASIYISQYVKNSSTAYNETQTWTPKLVRVN